MACIAESRAIAEPAPMPGHGRDGSTVDLMGFSRRECTCGEVFTGRDAGVTFEQREAHIRTGV